MSSNGGSPRILNCGDKCAPYSHSSSAKRMASSSCKSSANRITLITCDVSTYASYSPKSQSRSAINSGMLLVAGAVAFSLFDRALQIGNQLGMQRPNQQDQARLAMFQIRELLEVSNRPADAVLRDHQFQAFAWMDALAERNVDQGVDLLARIRCFDRGGDCFPIADGAKIRPGVLNIAVGQKQAPGFPRGLSHSISRNCCAPAPADPRLRRVESGADPIPGASASGAFQTAGDIVFRREIFAPANPGPTRRRRWQRSSRLNDTGHRSAPGSARAV